jgi:plasmid maintenance system antidote protein VapI
MIVEEGRTMAQRKKLPPIHPGELLRDELEEYSGPQIQDQAIS